MLRHVIHRIRRHWPQVAILVRGDSHYCAPEVLDLLREKRCDYILGFARNKTLDALAEPWREQCRWRWKPGLKVRRFHQLQYAAESWARQEKVVARVEATELGTDARFIVTNLTGRGKKLYEKVYCARGACREPDQGHEAASRAPTRPRARAGRPTSSASSCTWARTGCCMRCGWRRPSGRAGAAPPSRPSAATS